jgi:hypothetical protein
LCWQFHWGSFVLDKPLDFLTTIDDWESSVHVINADDEQPPFVVFDDEWKGTGS